MYSIGEIVKLKDPIYSRFDGMKGTIYMLDRSLIKILMDNGERIITIKEKLKPACATWDQILIDTEWFPETNY